MASSSQTKPKKNSGERNSDRPNGKAWKRRVCGRRHSPLNCRDCMKFYGDLHDRTRVAQSERRKARAAKASG